MKTQDLDVPNFDSVPLHKNIHPARNIDNFVTYGKVYKETILLKYFVESAKREVRGEKSMETHSHFPFTPTSFW